jgi:hypothetical protein
MGLIDKFVGFVADHAATRVEKSVGSGGEEAVGNALGRFPRLGCPTAEQAEHRKVGGRRPADGEVPELHAVALHRRWETT